MGEIFDRNLLRRNQKRFQNQFDEHDFLYKESASYMIHNIELINKDFENILEISSKDRSICDYISKIKNVKENICSSMNKFDFSDIVFSKKT